MALQLKYKYKRLWVKPEPLTLKKKPVKKKNRMLVNGMENSC